MNYAVAIPSTKSHDGFLKQFSLGINLPRLLVPTPFTKGGRPDPSAISKTIVPINVKFFRILDTSLNVLEM